MFFFSKTKRMFSKSLCAGGLGYFFYLLVYETQRAHILKKKPFLASTPTVFESSDFEEVQEICFEHGTLNPKLVKSLKNNNLYVLKGSHSRADFVKEYIVANYLALLRPGEQPSSIIMQERTASYYEKALFFNLSHKYENTEDIESFIRRGGNAFLEGAEIRGLVSSLLAIKLLGGENDAKLDNMVIQEIESENNAKKIFMIYLIDHEKVKSLSILRKKVIFTDNWEELISSIHDIYLPSENNHAGLAGDSRALEFFNKIKAQIDIKKEATFFAQQITKTNFEPLIETCNKLSSHPNGLFTGRECKTFKDRFVHLQKEAEEFLTKNEQEQNLAKII